jgi:hypothetical protein
MAMWEVFMPHRSFWDKLRAGRFYECVGTLKGDGLRVIGVTPSEVMVRWLCLERELLSVISSDAAGAWEKLRLDWMIQRGMGVD